MDGFNGQRFFRRLAVAQVSVWVLVPLLSQPNAPLDVVNLYYWGQQWAWGYSKHPPLPAWLCAVAINWLGGPWATYVFSQLAMLACFWAAWRLGREVLDPRRAALAAALLVTIHYYGYSSTEFNNNVGLMAFWALAGWFARAAVAGRRTRSWLALGACLGLAGLCKYPAAILAVSLLGWLLVDRDLRWVWRTPGPYLAGLVAVALVAPHLLWAERHDWITLTYAAERAGGEARSVWAHLFEPLAFVFNQGVGLLPLLIVVAPVLQRRRAEPTPLHRYLSWLCLGPIVLHLLIAALTGMHLRSMWGMPLFTFLGVWLLANFGREEIDERRWRRVIGGILVVGLGLAVGGAGRNWFGGWFTGRGERIHFNGPALAAGAQARWAERQPGQVPLVAGPWWLAGNVSVYARWHPEVYGELSRLDSPWSSDAELRRRGGLILYYADLADDRERGEQAPGDLADWRRRFPEAEELEPLILPWRSLGRLPPQTIGVLLVPPG